MTNLWLVTLDSGRLFSKKDALNQALLFVAYFSTQNLACVKDKEARSGSLNSSAQISEKVRLTLMMSHYRQQRLISCFISTIFDTK